MAIKLLTVNDVYNIREAKYIVDEENEKDLIPDEDKVQGTRVLVIKENKEYRMDSTGNWVEITKCGGCSGGLPSVTSDDNGKFLGVDSGEWKTVSAPSGGNGVTVIDLNHDITMPEIDGITDVYITWDGITYEPTTNIYIYNGDPTMLTALPIFFKYIANDGIVCDTASGVFPTTVLGSATDPKSDGNLTGLYLTADTQMYFYNSNGASDEIMLLPSTATFAVGHFGDSDTQPMQ